MANYYVRNLETDRLELHFDKSTYQALDRDVKGEIKRYFLFSRTAGAWVSKSSLQGAATWSASNIAQKLGLEDQGKTGEKVNEVTIVERRREKSARLSNSTGTFIDWEQYTPSERLNRDHNSVSFYDHDYPKAFRQEINETIADIQKRLNVSQEEDLPDYVKSAVERYAKSLSSYYTRYVNNRTYAPSPMVVGPARYPWHKLNKAHDRDGRNFADLDEAKQRLKDAVNRVQRGAADAKPTPEYLQNRVNQAQADVNKMQRGVDKGEYLSHYEPRLKQSQDLLAYWQKQLEEAGGISWSKEKLQNVGATHIQYNGYKYLPIIKVNDKTVLVGRWLTNESTTPYNVPYSKVTGYLVRWEDALMTRPGDKATKGPKAPKVEKAFKKGDKALYVTGYPNRPVQLVTIKTVGQKFYHVTGNLYGDKLPFEKVVPVTTGYEERLARMLAGAESYKKEIIDSLTYPDDTSKYDLKHFMNYGTHPYREDLLSLMRLDLVAAGYPEKGGLVAFFTDKYGIDKPKKKAKPAKNAARRKSATVKKVATSTRTMATAKKAAQRSLKTVIAVPSPVATAAVETKPAPKTKKSADKGEKVKLTAAQKKQIRQEGIDTVDQALATKKKELSAAQVIKIGKRINFLRTHLVIDGVAYQVREDFDSPVTNKRRLAPTEDNLKKWAANPGRYDLIGVDAAGKTDVTVFRKRDKNKVPTKLKVRSIRKGLTKLQSRTSPTPRRKPKKTA